MSKLSDIRKIIIMTGLLMLVAAGCVRDEVKNEPEFIIEGNKITAKYCGGFGNQIAACDDHVLVSSYYNVYIYKFSGENVELLQTIDFNESTTIVKMKISGNTLAIGINQYDGYKVVIYEKTADTWTFKQEIRSNRSIDGFGISIDFEGDYMIIGEPGQRSYGSGLTEGRMYIWHKTSEGWVEQHQFIAENSAPGDEFARAVAIHNDLAIAGSWLTYAHIYRKNGTWAFSALDTISVSAIFHSASSFLFFDYNLELRSFILQDNGFFSFHPVDFNYGTEFIVSFEMTDSYALATVNSANKCSLLKYSGAGWSKDSDLKPDTGESCNFFGLAFSGDYVIVGGESLNLSETSYVYFRKYR